MADIKYTPAQRQAVETRGTSLLLSAAAGSGKTFVLTQRLMAYVTDPNEPKDIDSFLIITFTRAAASELRARIASQLTRLAAENPANIRLRRQQNLCYRAQIGTIHSFCSDILRQHCHVLGLSPSFKVIEEERSAAIRDSVLEKLFESRYEEGRPEFLALADSIGAGRDDRRLAETVLSLYSKLCSHPYPEDWATEQAESFEQREVSDVSETIWGCELLESIKSSAAFWCEQMEQACKLMELADEKIIKAYMPSFTGSLESLSAFEKALTQSWDKARAMLPIPFERLGALRNYDDSELAERVKTIRDGCKKACEGFKESMAQSSAELISELRRCAPAMQELLALTMDFSRAFSAEKRRQNSLDFSDLEHYALELLVDHKSGQPTQTAIDISRRYTEIMVDEYQDVNAVQDMIFSAVSKQGKNLFMVGDVKQSIYRFRLADPSIFLKKYELFAKDSEAGQRILLQENFRSRRCVLNGTNLVFENIMSKKLGDLDYDEEAALKFGALSYTDEGEVPAELCIIDAESASDEEETPEKARIEAEYVADRIRQMIESKTPVYENGIPRPCTYSDFAILMRSPSGNGRAFHRALVNTGIPVQSKQGGGFFESLEISLSMDILSVIDDPHNDVALVSVLRSPAFGFTPDELAEIRGCSKTSDFYSALIISARTSNKSAAFIEKLTALRQISADLSIDELLWQVFNRVNLFALCSAMPDGDTRRLNLMRLFEYSRKFETSGFHGLYRFINWLRRLADRGDEVAVGSGENVVRIMSIHKSKGLEFPFVFLCDLSKRFNRNDSRSAVLLHEKLGLGPKLTDRDRGLEYPTLARRAIEHRMLQESLSEEMRVLYVAMTRAKERLIMSCVWKNPQLILDRLRAQSARPIPSEYLRSHSSMSHWLAAAALLDESRIKINVCTATEQLRLESSAAGTDTETIENAELLAELKKRLSFVYPHAAAQDLPTKLTATGIKGRADDAETTAESAALVKENFVPRFKLPRFARENSLTPAERGTAAHAFLQHADLTRLQSIENIKSEALRLSETGHLSPQQAKAIDTDSILSFTKSEIFARMLSAKELKREFRFTLLAPAGDYFENGGEDELLLQGIIDCYIVEDDGICIIDYKTDNISPEQLKDRAKHYTVQLQTYAKALERIRCLPVKECVLYFLRLGTSYPIAMKKE